MLELKEKRSRETLGRATSRAVQQHTEKDYAAELRARGVSPIHEFAIAFDGKRVRVKLRGSPPKRLKRGGTPATRR